MADVELDDPPVAASEAIGTPLSRLSRDLRNASKTLSKQEARFLVDQYYQMQENRIRAKNQTRSTLDDVGQAREPNEVLSWLATQHELLENQIRVALNQYTLAHPVGRWSQSICGIGPVIAAGLLAHIDITRAATVGHLWSFAGANPNAVWKTGERRPWNARLKVLRWKIGESFVKVSSRENDFYGKFYVARKKLEEERNQAGVHKQLAAETLAAKKFRADSVAREWYEKGMLPPARIHLRATRYAAKLFLAHWHHVAYFHHYQRHPPKPYVLDILGHAHEIQVPNWPFAK